MNRPETSRSVAEEITATLRDEILRGQYRPGERLPSERELATRFSANRGAVREALKKLEQMGITCINPGGVRVVPVEDASLDVLGHIIDLKEVPDAELTIHLFEVLGALMSMSARTAMQAASDEELARIHELVRAMIEANGNAEANQANWSELGRLLSHINNNLVLRLILNGLKTQFLSRLINKGPNVTFDPCATLEILNRMDVAIRERNAYALANAIGGHFELVCQTVKAAFASAAPSPQES